MSGGTAVAFAIGLPLFGTILILLNDRYPNIREGITITTSICLALVVFGLVPEVTSGGRPGFVLAEIVPGLPIAFKVEPLGMLFALVASGLWVVTSIYAIGYMRSHHEVQQTRFYACFAIAISSAMGICFAGNMLTLFIFYEVLTISTYPLVTHSESKDAVKAGRTYLGILIGTSIAFFLLAIIWTWFLTGTLDFTPGGILKGTADGPILGFLLFLYIYGIGKAALMPIHRWLPAAMVAPTPVSALLHAVAVVKVGVFCVLRILTGVFGIELLSTTSLSTIVCLIASFTVIVSSLIALTQDNLKRRLAFSTVGQLSYIVLGAGIATTFGVVGSMTHIAMHAFGKITLFFCAGAIYVATGKKYISQMVGLGRQMPITMIAFLVGSMSIIGLPLTGGIISKWYMILGAMDAEKLWILVIYLISSLLNAAYFLPIVYNAFFCKDEDTQFPNKVKEAPLAALLPPVITAIGTGILFFYPELFLNFAKLAVGVN